MHRRHSISFPLLDSPILSSILSSTLLLPSLSNQSFHLLLFSYRSLLSSSLLPVSSPLLLLSSSPLVSVAWIWTTPGGVGETGSSSAPPGEGRPGCAAPPCPRPSSPAGGAWGSTSTPRPTVRGRLRGSGCPTPGVCRPPSPPPYHPLMQLPS